MARDNGPKLRKMGPLSRSKHSWGQTRRMVQKVGRRVDEPFFGEKWFRKCDLSSDGARKASLDFHKWFAISLLARTSRQLIQNSV